MEYQEWKKKKERSDNAWTGIIILAFICFWPAGIALVVLKNAGKLPILGTGQTLQQWRQTLAHLAQQQPAAAPPPASPKQQDRAKRKLKFGGALLGTGVTLAVLGLLQIVTAHPAGHSFWALWRAFAVGTTFLAGGSALAILGGLRKKQSQRLQQYVGMIDPDCGYLSIYELADRVHRPYKQVCEDLQKMIDMRTWDAAWLDLQRGRLMLTPYDPDEEAPAADTVQEAGAAKSAAEQVLQQIRADNDLIADPEISRKIDRIETLTGKIFDYLEKHPERAGELQTFMDYYLPQTLKTLETYARLEAEGIETDSIRQAKAKISGILDKLCDGYEKQLDKLFQTDAMDITADIAVMEQMLKKDGLTEDEFAFEIKGK